MAIVILDRKARRKKRVSSNIRGTSEVPRISIYRSSMYIYAQAIDDVARKTVASFSSLLLKKDKDSGKESKTTTSKQIGRKLAEMMQKQKISRAVFDRGPYQYKGRVRSLAEGMREAGITI